MDSRQEPRTELEMVRAGILTLTDRLPPRWGTSEIAETGDAVGDRGLRVTAPDNRAIDLILSVRRTVESRDVPALRDCLRDMGTGLSDTQVVVVSKFLSPTVRKRLADAGISYVDATGNISVQVDLPGLSISAGGADRDPWRGPGRPRGTLKGSPAAKVVRTLIDIDREWAIRDLIRESGASTGSTYRVIEFLEAEELMARTVSGSLVVEDWTKLLRRWSMDYSFMDSSAVSRWVAPRGLPALMEAAARSTERYAVTGSLAAATWSEYAPSRNAMVYVEDSSICAEAWGLRAAESGVNVLLAEPSTEAVFQRTIENDRGVLCAAPSQVAVDLLTGPGRNPSEAEELIDWMQRNESQWRRR